MTFRDVCRRSTFGHAVVLPDIDTSQIANRPTRPDEILLGHQNVQPDTVQRSIEDAYQFWRRDASQSLGSSAVSEIVKLYAPSWNIRPPLINQLEEEDSQMKELTEQQFNMLTFLQRQKRVAISGCAGSGKTFLAIEHARRLARRGLHVLLTCYNRNLANWLREQIMEETRGDADLSNIDVFNFHRIASRLCAQANIALPSNESHDFDVAFAEGLFQASEKITERYDAIIADEGQDFDDSWWVALLSLLRSSEEDYFYVFYDDNQRIYGQQSSYPVPPDHHYTLSINCRTTQKIHQEMVRYYSADERPTCKGPLGRVIEQIDVPPQAQAEYKKLLEVLRHLTQQEGIPLDQIVLLSPVGKDASRFRDGTTLGAGLFRLNWQMEGPPQRNALTCCSIFSFKGLERMVVILAEPDKIQHTAVTEYERLIYVALSRAKQYLIVLGNLPVREG